MDGHAFQAGGRPGRASRPAGQGLVNTAARPGQASRCCSSQQWTAALSCPCVQVHAHLRLKAVLASRETLEGRPTAAAAPRVMPPLVLAMPRPPLQQLFCCNEPAPPAAATAASDTAGANTAMEAEKAAATATADVAAQTATTAATTKPITTAASAAAAAETLLLPRVLRASTSQEARASSGPRNVPQARTGTRPRHRAGSRARLGARARHPGGSPWGRPLPPTLRRSVCLTSSCSMS